jgi:integrating conjugative element protein (TIGR03761 family)
MTLNPEVDMTPPTSFPIEPVAAHALADSSFAGDVAPGAAAAGRLVDATPDAMMLHTLDAYRMFTGRAADPATQAPAIPGGRRFAAILKGIWYLSASDNPYADWLLIRVYQSLADIRAQMNQIIAAREAEFERLRARGLALSVLASRSPVAVSLEFRSPYGYAAAEAILEFDFHVRMVKTLVLKDRMGDAAGRAEIRVIGRQLRGLFLEPIRWERHLLREEMLPLSRRDFLPGADAAARQRVSAAVALFGELPRKVFTGEEAPRHSQRRVSPTAAELRLMQEVSLRADAMSAPPAEQLL